MLWLQITRDLKNQWSNKNVKIRLVTLQSRIIDMCETNRASNKSSSATSESMKTVKLA